MTVTVQLKTEHSCHRIFIMHQCLLLAPCQSTVNVRVTYATRLPGLAGNSIGVYVRTHDTGHYTGLCHAAGVAAVM